MNNMIIHALIAETAGEFTELGDTLRHMYTDDPTNWLKFALVFAILVVGYIIILPVYRKVSYYLSYERKKDIALSRGHVTEAKLVKYRKSWDDSDTGARTWYIINATYEYVMGGQTKKFRAQFKGAGQPPQNLSLYWINNPRKVFAVDEYHYENHKAFILMPIMLFPWVMAGLAFYLLKLHLIVASW